MLRSKYLSAYLSQVRVPYTSDPFPVAAGSSGGQFSSLPVYGDSGSPSSFYDAYGRPVARHLSDSHSDDHSSDLLRSRGRETAIFDRFICLRIGSDLRRAESDLSLDGDDERDLFVRLQPAARLEDLLLQRALSAPASRRLVDPPPNPLPEASNLQQLRRMPFDHLSIKFAPPRRVSVNLAVAGAQGAKTWRCLGEVQRAGKDEELEETVRSIETLLRQTLE